MEAKIKERNTKRFSRRVFFSFLLSCLASDWRKGNCAGKNRRGNFEGTRLQREDYVVESQRMNKTDDDDIDKVLAQVRVTARAQGNSLM